MAQTLSLTVSATAEFGNFKDSFTPGAVTIALANQGAASGIVDVGTSEEDLSIGDVGASTQGYLILRNLDSSNYVTYGPKSGGAMVVFGRIKPGEIAVLRLEPSVVVRWQANTAAVKVQVKLFAA